MSSSDTNQPMEPSLNLKSALIFLFFLLIPVFIVSDYNSKSSVHSDIDIPPIGNERFGNIPLYFEENNGQIDTGKKYFTRTRGYIAFFSQKDVQFFLKNKSNNQTPGGTYSPITMRLVSGNKNPKVSGQDKLRGKSHYFTGRDKKSWRTNKSHFAKLNYKQVYPGIDLVFYGNQNQLEFDFIVQPGVSPDIIAFEFDGAQGVHFDGEGSLLLETVNGPLTMHAPKLYQEIDSEKLPIEGRFSLNQNGSIGFEVHDYNPQFALVIDPTLTYSTYVGGDELDHPKGIAQDGEGNIYVAGFSRSSLLPEGNPISPISLSGLYAFVLKFDPSGTDLEYATYLDGESADACLGLAVDDAGNAYITGYTKSPNFPLQHAWQTEKEGPRDAFIAKLNPDGSELDYCTYFGGAGWDIHDTHPLDWRGNDQGNAIDIDESGNAYIAGETDAFDFPVTETAWDTTAGVIELTYTSTSYHDGFAAKFSPEGRLQYSTFIGGDEEEDMEWREQADDDYCNGICVDSNGNAYVTGRTYSYAFPTTQNAFQQTMSGWRDAFVVKLNPDGSDAMYSTYLGGGEYDEGLAIAADMDGRAYITGTTHSADFPIKNAFQPEYGGHPDIEWYWYYGGDAFVSVLNPSGSNLEYSTYIGGEERDKAWAIAVDDSSNAYVTGHTYSAEFPKLSSLNPDIIGRMDAFITKLKANGEPAYSTLLGGDDKKLYGENVYTETGTALFVDDFYNLYVTGRTNAADFPTLNAYQDELEGSMREGNEPFTDLFITKFGSEMSMIPDGVAIDPDNWDKHVGELQSTFSDLKIIGAGLDNVEEIIFKLNDEPDVYIIPQNIYATTTEVKFDLVVAHAAELGERDIILKMDDGSEIDVSQILGKKFFVSRVRTYYNQAVNQNSLDTHGYRDVLVANKRGVARLVLDDESQYNHTFTGKLKVKGISGDSTSIRPYEYRDEYSEQEIVNAMDDMIIPIPGPPDEGEHTLKITLTRDDNTIFLCPDIKREFVETSSMRILFLRFRIGFADGQSLGGVIRSVNAADIPGAVDYIRKVYPISENQLTYKDFGDLTLLPEFATKTAKLGSGNIVVVKDEDTIIDILLFLDQYLDSANRLMNENFNVIVAFMPGASLFLDEDNDKRVGEPGESKPIGCTLDGTRAIIVTPTYDDQLQPQNLGSTLAHELGHRILDIALETAELPPEYGENLGDEYKGGSFHTDVNPPILGNIDKNKVAVQNSPYIFGVSGDSSAIFTDRSTFDTWSHEPKLTYLGEEVSVITHNFMGNARPDSVLWVSLRCYDELMKSLVPTIDLGLQKSFTIDPVLRITGNVTKDGGGNLVSVLETSTGVTSPENTGAYTLEVANAAGATLVSNSFDPLFILNTNPPEDIDEAQFSIRMSKVIGAKRVVLKKDGMKLDEIVLSDHAPTIEIQSPQTGDEIKKSTVVSWTAADQDGDNLTFSILYELADDKVLPVASGITSNSFALQTVLFDHSPGSITVVASDGFNRSSDTVTGITVGVSQNPQINTPGDCRLGQNYPNPFNNGTTIHYDISSSNSSKVRIEIFNALGEHVKTLINKKQNAGTHSVIWEGDTKSGEVAPSGVYFYRLQINGNEQVKKMLKIQ